MNTLKKGDKCQFQHLKVTIEGFDGRWVEICHNQETGGTMYVAADELTRIPTHAERMQAVLDIAWDVENRLQDDETVQLTVGAFVEFARHYAEIVGEFETILDEMRGNQIIWKGKRERAEKLLKGEL